jgi:hypothetical protein
MPGVPRYRWLWALSVLAWVGCSIPHAPLEGLASPDASPDSGLDSGIDAGPDAGSDAGPDSGLVPHCTIDGVEYASRALNPANRAQCCNPVGSPQSWTSLFTMGASYGFNVVAGGLSTVVLADFDGDGRLDVAVAGNSGNDTVWVFLNLGDGGLSSPSLVATADLLYGGIAAADLDGDGLPDLVVANQNDAVGVLLNRGGGRFAPEVDFTASSQVQRVTVGDLNGDGWPDVLAGEKQAAGVFLNLAQGDGKLGSEALYEPGFSEQAAYSGVGDFNGDGMLDFAINQGQPGGSVVIYLNDGGGTFGSPIYNTSVAYPWGAATGKLTTGAGDDLIVTSSANSAFVVIDSADVGGLLGGVLYGGGGQIAAVADVDGDGSQDVVSTDGTSLYLSFNEGDGTLWDAASISTGSSMQWFAVGDLNGDGAPDVALLRYGMSGPLELWFNGCP